VDLILQLAVEQPLKTPFAAAVVLVVNTLTHQPPSQAAAAAPNGGGDGLDTNMENGGQDQPQTAEPQPTSGVVDDLLAKAAAQVEEKVRLGEWRAVKLLLKLLACLQSCLEGEGVFPILEDLFNQAVELQTANNEDVSFLPEIIYCLYGNVQGRIS
jgi:nuclear cap-binding protein subunit 1